MRFLYSSVISTAAGSGDFILLRRPEIPVTIFGPRGSAAFIGLVVPNSELPSVSQ